MMAKQLRPHHRFSCIKRIVKCTGHDGQHGVAQGGDDSNDQEGLEAKAPSPGARRRTTHALGQESGHTQPTTVYAPTIAIPSASGRSHEEEAALVASSYDPDSRLIIWEPPANPAGGANPPPPMC